MCHIYVCIASKNLHLRFFSCGHSEKCHKHSLVDVSLRLFNVQRKVQGSIIAPEYIKTPLSYTPSLPL